MEQEQYKTLEIFDHSPENKYDHLRHTLSTISDSESFTGFNNRYKNVSASTQRTSSESIRDISLSRLEAMDLIRVETNNDKLTLTNRGRDVASGELRPLLNSFCDTFIGFYDTIEILSVAPLRISTVREYLNEAYNLSWSGNREPKRRADWLRDMGLVTLDDSNEYQLTEKGTHVHESLRENRGPSAIASLFSGEDSEQLSTESAHTEIESGPMLSDDSERAELLQEILDAENSDIETADVLKNAEELSERSPTERAEGERDGVKGEQVGTASERDYLPLIERVETKVISIHVNKSDEMIDRYEDTVAQDSSISDLDGVEADGFPRDAIRYWKTTQQQLDEIEGIVRGDILLFHHYDDGYIAAGRVLSVRETASDDEYEQAVLLEQVSTVGIERTEIFELLDWDVHPKARWIRIDNREAVTDEYGSVDVFVTAIEAEERFDYWDHEHWGLDERLARRLARQLKRKGQAILYGPPGTGKTFSAENFASWWTGKQSGTQPTHSQTESITFHPSYTYEDFVEGYTITEKNNQAAHEGQSDTGESASPYGLEPGLFKTFCEKAKAVAEATEDGRTPPRYVLVIDELNRGNVTRIFGENITLLEKDKRGNTRQLSYSGSEFTVPENVYLIGTMNTADQSISRLDAAIRRRFAAVATPPQYDVLYNVSNDLYPDNRESAYELVDSGRSDTAALLAASILALEIINKQLVSVPGLGKGKRLGHSYLLPETWLETDEEVSDDTTLADVWRYDILPLLEEYFFEDLETLQERIFEGEAEFVDPETNDIVYMEPPQLRDALTAFVVDHRQLLPIELENE
jgi:5-methylcytosine-specific restriction protein B